MFDVGRQAHSTFCLLFQMALGGLPGHSSFCILHSASILVVAAGPGILQVFKYLFPLMKGIQ